MKHNYSGSLLSSWWIITNGISLIRTAEKCVIPIRFKFSWLHSTIIVCVKRWRAYDVPTLAQQSVLSEIWALLITQEWFIRGKVRRAEICTFNAGIPYKLKTGMTHESKWKRIRFCQTQHETSFSIIKTTGHIKVIHFLTELQIRRPTSNLNSKLKNCGNWKMNRWLFSLFFYL